jgi:hypothetical protein
MMRRDIQADRAIVKAATPGPWTPYRTKYYGVPANRQPLCVGSENESICTLTASEGDDGPWPDASFIALARTALPYYMDAYEQAEARAVKAERELELLAQEYVKNKPCFRPVEEGKDPAQDIIDQFKAKAMAPEAFKFCLTCGGCGKPLSCAVYQELARKENLLGRVTSEENTR